LSGWEDFEMMWPFEIGKLILLIERELALFPRDSLLIFDRSGR
jgi:hypothetical protein